MTHGGKDNLKKNCGGFFLPPPPAPSHFHRLQDAGLWGGVCANTVGQGEEKVRNAFLCSGSVPGCHCGVSGRLGFGTPGNRT